MVYTLNENVYLVKGYAKSCIYDFNLSKLYSITNTLAQKIDEMNFGQLTIDDICKDKELKNIFDEFIRLGILILSESPDIHEIDEIKAVDNGFKFAWIEITNQCNLRCRHCYNESAPKCNTIMALEKYKIVVDGLLDLGIEKIQLIGGEPFFNKKLLKDMLEYTVGKFPIIEIFTNGTLITSDWLDYLAENNIHLAISVYSYQNKVHDSVTGINGSWNKTNESIKLLKSHGIVYRVCNVLMKDVQIGEKSTDLYNLSNNKDIVRMAGRADFNLLTDELIRKKLITQKSFQNKLNRHFCGNLIAGHNCFRDRLYIAADMSVFPCVMERRLRHCNIDEVGKFILNDEICHFNRDKIEGCAQCEYRYACFDCRPNSLSGNINEKPWYCTYQPLLGKWEDEDEFIKNLKIQWG